MYKKPNRFNGQENDSCIIRLSDNACIPLAPDNTDYQAYLKWVDEGGIPEPANE